MRLGFGQGVIVSLRALGISLEDPISHLGALVRLGFSQEAIVSPRALGVPLEHPSPI